ncbi:leishmanolysin-like peptidase [Biomphalaria pfeifferi]|uniref:Leishmanolysin-like peptidase n=1 Tax=Biomphalaria pfeifferi TaxID=112525 RepID=A0AAD8BRH8_BIOPF|nr:leishmanolysin-like peptidase [Biomphalaria pfeifferi]
MGCLKQFFQFPFWVLIFNCLFVLQAEVPRIRNENHCHHTVGRLQDDVFYNVQLDSEHVIRKRDADQPLRIHLHFDDSISELSLERQMVVKAHVQEAAHFWESALNVRRSATPIRLRRTCMYGVRYNKSSTYCLQSCKEITLCGAVRVPEKHLDVCRYWDRNLQTYIDDVSSSPGIDADFILYVASKHSERCQQSKAFAAHCQQEAALDRPVAGYCNICPSIILASVYNTKQLLTTIKHEILHALGFTSGLYAFYRNSLGEPLTERDPITRQPRNFSPQMNVFLSSTNTVRSVLRPNWHQISGVATKKISMMVTPKVVEEVRRHFNCSSLEGAELEDQGGNGTAVTHWEKRIFENEAMTGTYTHNSIFSRITFAMMEDTGWYKADYSKSGEYEWGRNLGCNFVQDSCYNWINERLTRRESIHPFCNLVKRGELWTDCSLDRKSVVICNLVEYKQPVSARYQYFHSLPGIPTDSVSRFAGSVELADYCPFLQELSWLNELNVTDRGSNCQDSNNNIRDERKNYFGELYSSNSLCFEHASKWYLHQCDSIHSPQHSGSGCYQYSCVAGIGLVIHVHNTTYQCKYTKQVINLVFKSSTYLHQGSLVCPNCSDLCPSKGVICPPESNPSVFHGIVIDQRSPCNNGNRTRQHKVFLLWMVLLGLTLIMHHLLLTVDYT